MCVCYLSFSPSPFLFLSSRTNPTPPCYFHHPVEQVRFYLPPKMEEQLLEHFNEGEVRHAATCACVRVCLRALFPRLR